MRPLARLGTVVAAAALAVTGTGLTASAEPGGGAQVVRGQAFYVDGEPYRTVLTPRDLPRKAPDHSFDLLYDFGGAQPAVAEAAPGLRGYNGGRWIVNAVTLEMGWEEYADGTHDGQPAFVSNEAVEEAIDAGALTVDEDVRRFVCPVIKL